MNREEFKEDLGYEILNEMHDCFTKIIKNPELLEHIKQNQKGFYVATKESDDVYYYMKLAHKTQEEYIKKSWRWIKK